MRHIEPEHIADIPVPRLSAAIERRINRLIDEAMELRQRFEDGIKSATADLFHSAGLAELLEWKWHDEPRDLDFSAPRPSSESLRALNFAPRARRIWGRLAGTPHQTLGDICSGGVLGSGGRFKRVDSDPALGVRLIGQRQGFWMRPEGRWIDRRYTPHDVFAKDETVLVAATGTLGESEVFCRPILATGNWLQHAYTEHFLRVVSGNPSFPGAYLYAFLRSEPAFRMLRSVSTGGKQQDLHESFRARMPVPECAAEDRERIADTVRRAHQDRDEADKKEDQALAVLEDAVRKAAR